MVKIRPQQFKFYFNICACSSIIKLIQNTEAVAFEGPVCRIWEVIVARNQLLERARKYIILVVNEAQNMEIVDPL